MDEADGSFIPMSQVSVKGTWWKQGHPSGDDHSQGQGRSGTWVAAGGGDASGELGIKVN